MIDSFVFFEMCLIGACVFIQKTRERQIVAGWFALIVILHDLFFHTFSNNLDAYYFTNAVLALIFILTLSQRKEYPRLTEDLQFILVFSILFDWVGWLLYYKGYEAYAYMTVYVLLYGWAIYYLIRGEPHGDRKTDTRFLSIRPNVYHWFVQHYHQEKKRWEQKHSQIR